jgi:hypothetical protein
MDSLTLPETDDYVLLLGIVAALEWQTAKELEKLIDVQFKASGESDWFESIKHYRQSRGEPFGYKSPTDLRFLLSEATHEDSQIWHLIPGVSQAWMNAAQNLKFKLNQFHHQQLSPDLNTLLVVSTLMDTVATGPALQSALWARALISRSKALLSGNYVPKAQAEVPDKTDEIAEIEKKYSEVVEARAKRPPLGSPWTGERPQRHLTLDRRTRDVYDKNGISVMGEIEQVGTEVIDKWLWYFPLGGDIFVADDGAVMGFIKGDKYMIGWLGPEPEGYSKQVRGYVLPHEYFFTGEAIIHVSTGHKLQDVARDDSGELLAQLIGTVKHNVAISISDYGDLFVPLEEGEPEKLATAHRGIWFPGHLPGDNHLGPELNSSL